VVIVVVAMAHPSVVDCLDDERGGGGYQGGRLMMMGDKKTVIIPFITWARREYG